MAAPAAGSVILVPFPFSDLSRSKIRPALVLADAGRGDCILCQVTSKAYADPRAIPLEASDFAAGGLQLTSYVRPAKLFTASEVLLLGTAGTLRPEKMRTILREVARLFGQAG